MKRLLIIPILLLSIFCNAQFTKGGGMFLKTGSGFMTAPSTGGGDANDLLTNLVAYWDFEETTGNAIDEINGYEMAVSGTVDQSNTGKLGNAYLYDGTSGYLSTTDVANLRMNASNFTFAAWVYADAGAFSAYRIIFGAESYGACLQVTDESGIQLRSVDYFLAASAATVATQQWLFVAVVFNVGVETNNVTYYVNSNTYTVSMDDEGGAMFGTNAGTIYIGIQGTTYWDGMIDDAAIWKGRMLSETELDWLYNSGTGREFSELQ